jgi:hypothetical protein
VRSGQRQRGTRTALGAWKVVHGRFHPCPKGLRLSSPFRGCRHELDQRARSVHQGRAGAPDASSASQTIPVHRGPPHPGDVRRTMKSWNRLAASRPHPHAVALAPSMWACRFPRERGCAQSRPRGTGQPGSPSWVDVPGRVQPHRARPVSTERGHPEEWPAKRVRSAHVAVGLNDPRSTEHIGAHATCSRGRSIHVPLS